MADILIVIAIGVVILLGVAMVSSCGGEDYAPPADVCEVPEWCCRVCTVGKPCGDTCIDEHDRCGRGDGCACECGGE